MDELRQAMQQLAASIWAATAAMQDLVTELRKDGEQDPG